MMDENRQNGVCAIKVANQRSTSESELMQHLGSDVSIKNVSESQKPVFKQFLLMHVPSMGCR